MQYKMSSSKTGTSSQSRLSFPGVFHHNERRNGRLNMIWFDSFDLFTAAETNNTKSVTL